MGSNNNNFSTNKKTSVASQLSSGQASHPYTSIASSPDGRYAVVAGKDNLRFVSISPSGLSEICFIRTSQYFQATQSSGVTQENPDHRNAPPGRTYESVREAFSVGAAVTAQNSPAAHHVTVTTTITDVAWSPIQSNHLIDNHAKRLSDSNATDSDSLNKSMSGTSEHYVLVGGGANTSNINDHVVVSGGGVGTKNTQRHHKHSTQKDVIVDDDSLVAAAGSNGVVVVWRASALLAAASTKTTSATATSSSSSDTATTSPSSSSAGLQGIFHLHGLAHRHQQQQHPTGTAASGLPDTKKTSMGVTASMIQPEAVLVHHKRAVNRLAWHRNKPGLLLTASQDSTVKLWDRRTTSSNKQDVSSSSSSSQTNSNKANPANTSSIRNWFGGYHSWSNPSSRDHNDDATRSFSWHCASVFQTNEAIRDIEWSPFDDDIFAMVTDNGFLTVYTIRLKMPMIRIAAHAREATTLNWHPTRRYILATGGVDRTVKVWDLENGLNLNKSDESMDNLRLNFNSHRSEQSFDGNVPSPDTSPVAQEGDGASPNSLHRTVQHVSFGTLNSMSSSGSLSHGSSLKRSLSGLHGLSRYQKGSSVAKNKHVLSISAPVTRLKWRPPAGGNGWELLQQTSGGDTDCGEFVDHHDSMLAVATAPLRGANVGGHGFVGLWSYNRPFMPLSVIEGHNEGAITDFLWIDTPERSDEMLTSPNTHSGESAARSNSGYGGVNTSATHRNVGLPLSSYRNDSSKKRISDDTEIDGVGLVGTWQHILSVGRDGKCLLQSFARGERPIFQVPPSTFAIANLSPFQSGYGSLQIMSVHQNVPSGHNNDFAFSRLKCNDVSSQAPGVFKEFPTSVDEYIHSKTSWKPKAGGQPEPGAALKLTLSVTDNGDLDESSNLPSSKYFDGVAVAPEVVHLSRFAEFYKLRRDMNFPTKYDLCRHNAKVAYDLKCDAHGRMWNMLASLLEGCDSEDISNGKQKKQQFLPKSPMEFLLLPTLRSLLYERAEAGDVQTCVAICEVMEIIPPQSKTNPQLRGKPVFSKSVIPGIEIDLLREWYLSYIDILQQMCLFSHATDLIRNCNDHEIGKLNQNSTTIHESCPSCWKPLQGVTTMSELDRNGHERKILTTQRACKSCRQRIGLCFLCHEPVTGVFVWCPGCGHGGHLDHALEWFGGSNNNPLQQFCPTGCGHKCNLVQHSNASTFPRTDSLIELEHR